MDLWIGALVAWNGRRPRVCGGFLAPGDRCHRGTGDDRKDQGNPVAETHGPIVLALTPPTGPEGATDSQAR